MTAIAAPAESERGALALAAAAHLALFALLSLTWHREPPRAWPQPVPIEVSLVDKVAPEATAPPVPTPPAPSIAPDQGTPEDAAPAPRPEPEPVKTEAVKPTPPAPAPKPAIKPEPKPATAVKPAPAKPAPAKPAAPVPAKPQPTAARPSRLAGLGQELAAGAKADAHAVRPRGARLGADFLKGLSPDAPARTASDAAPAAKAGPFPTASIVGAIARQIQPCADRQVDPGPGANRITTTLDIRLNADGTLAASPRMLRQAGVDDANERYAQRVVDLGVAAFKGCTPLRLPAEYFSGWSHLAYQWKLR